MARWEFHLSVDELGNSTRWVWLHRDDDGEARISSTAFPSYRECLQDALRNGYAPPDLPELSDRQAA